MQRVVGMRFESRFRRMLSSFQKTQPRFYRMEMIAVIAFLTCATSVAAQTFELSNGHITAVFGPRGLTAISNRTFNHAVHFRSDEFSMMVDDIEIESEKLTPKIDPSSAKSLAYIYSSHGYVLRVVYRLESGWDFVSKQLQVIRGPNESFLVHCVEPLQESLEEAISSEFTPGAYLPQFGKNSDFEKRIPAKKFGAFLRFPQNYGMMLLAQNPFLAVSREGQTVSVSYVADMRWETKWGPFVSDISCLRLYLLTGERIPAEMVLEWKLPSQTIPDDGADQGEIRAFSDCVREFLVSPFLKPISVEVGWTLNDYQIDVSKPKGRQEYKRIIDTTAELGIQYLLYAPANYALAQTEKDADDWNWEHVLWLGLGQEIREAKWDVHSSPLPLSIKEMLNYAKTKHVGLLAYVYPSLPFAQNNKWLVLDPSKGDKELYATLASREFQDFLIAELLAFKRRTGIAGYSFDYTFLNVPGSSDYSQWWGWRRVMESLRQADPNIVIDGRQTYQAYGPWSWLAGNYPHPTGNDEQAESFQPFPDLHFDRVSADRERFVNYWYRNYQFAPEELIPGYATHQTERAMNVPEGGGTDGHEKTVRMMYGAFRRRDWDYLGYRYSFISSIATGGWNNVVNMIPARDEEEVLHFSNSDKAWIRRWLQWTIANSDYLRHTKTILGQPAIGKADGTSALIGDQGYLFLFNPNYKIVSADVRLDTTIGLSAGDKFILREVYPRDGALVGRDDTGIWSYGDTVHLDLAGTTAKILKLVPLARMATMPIVFNSADSNATATLRSKILRLEHISGEPGSEENIGVLLPKDSRVSKVLVNGRSTEFVVTGEYVSIHLRFAGLAFGHAQQLKLVAPPTNKTLQGSFVIPQRVVSQLSARRRHWPIPWNSEDYETTWLVPERLLLFVEIAGASDEEQPHVTVDGQAVILKRAYSSVRVHPASFVGFYADISDATPDLVHTLQIDVSELSAGVFQGVFFDNVEPEYTEVLSIPGAHISSASTTAPARLSREPAVQER
jgi:hypothetical protein